MDVIEYESLVTDFETRLVTQLRSHGADADYLEMWVPDSDVVKSLLNMVEAASAYGREALAVRLRSGTIAPAQVEALTEEIGDLGTVNVTPESGGMLIAVTGIKAQ